MKEGESLDLSKVREFLEKSGFTVPKIELTVRGRLEKWEDMPALRTPGGELFVLANGAASGQLRQETPLGERLRVTGSLHLAHEDGPKGLTVERFEVIEP